MRPKRYSIQWTDEAEGDAMSIVNHFDSRINAERVLVRIAVG
jgi:hypothetical protein